MKKLFQISTSNKKGRQLTMSVEVSHSQTAPGVPHEFTAEIISSSFPVSFEVFNAQFIQAGENITALGNAYAVSDSVLKFGLGEIEKQQTTPFQVFAADAPRNKQTRFLFTFPVLDKSDFLNYFKEV
jgi:hypothetical protein